MVFSDNLIAITSSVVYSAVKPTSVITISYNSRPEAA